MRVFGCDDRGQRHDGQDHDVRLNDGRGRPPRTRRLVPHAGFVRSGATWAGKIIPGEPQHGRQHEREQEHARERTTRNHRFQCNAAKYRGRAVPGPPPSALDTFSFLIMSTGMTEYGHERSGTIIDSAPGRIGDTLDSGMANDGERSRACLLRAL